MAGHRHRHGEDEQEPGGIDGGDCAERGAGPGRTGDGRGEGRAAEAGEVVAGRVGGVGPEQARPGHDQRYQAAEPAREHRSGQPGAQARTNQDHCGNVPGQHENRRERAGKKDLIARKQCPLGPQPVEAGAEDRAADQGGQGECGHYQPGQASIMGAGDDKQDDGDLRRRVSQPRNRRRRKASDCTHAVVRTGPGAAAIATRPAPAAPASPPTGPAANHPALPEVPGSGSPLVLFRCQAAGPGRVRQCSPPAAHGVVFAGCVVYRDEKPVKAGCSVRLLACELGSRFPTWGGTTPLDPPLTCCGARRITGRSPAVKARLAGPVRSFRRNPRGVPGPPRRVAPARRKPNCVGSFARQRRLPLARRAGPV